MHRGMEEQRDLRQPLGQVNDLILRQACASSWARIASIARGEAESAQRRRQQDHRADSPPRNGSASRGWTGCSGPAQPEESCQAPCLSLDLLACRLGTPAEPAQAQHAEGQGRDQHHDGQRPKDQQRGTGARDRPNKPGRRPAGEGEWSGRRRDGRPVIACGGVRPARPCERCPASPNEELAADPPRGRTVLPRARGGARRSSRQAPGP